MFTGIIEDVGKILHVGSGTLTLETKLHDLKIGESLSVSGVCLTLTSIQERRQGAKAGFSFSPETAARTTIGSLRSGARVNLERALRADSRLGGHILSGHVEGRSRLLLRQREGNSQLFKFLTPRDLAHYLVVKGSIGIDGISLTIVECRRGCFSVSVVPYTLEQTNLREMAVGQVVNIEPDLFAKYAESALTRAAHGEPLSLEMLRRNGFIP